MQDPLGLVGTQVDDKYLIESLVGEGGFALVYRAQHLIFKRPVAIKAFRTMSELGAEQRDKLLKDFIQEGALLADLSERSAAIVQARDVGTLTTPDGHWVPYMVLEWLDGASLDAVLAQERRAGALPRTIEQVVEMLNPVAEALALAHKRGIAHRDVKPANVFICGDPRGVDYSVKLLDFGIAKVVQDVQKMGGFTKTQGTVTSFTPAYGAPEQFSRTLGATGPWTDVFAFACLMSEVLTHRAPLEGDDVVQLGFASAHAENQSTPRAHGAVVPEEVEAVFRKALAAQPVARYQTAGELWNALRSALNMSTMRLPASTATPVVAPTGVSPPKSGTGKTVAIASAAALALLAASAVTIHVVAGKDSRTQPLASASASASASMAVAPPVPTCPVGMIRIEGGEFFMGSADPHALPNEKPPHSVALTPFCIDKTEVTVAAYKACSDGGKCLTAGKGNLFAGFDDLPGAAKTALDSLCNINEVDTRASHPINCIDWDQASTFCSRTAPGGRLPTEAEWEFAARGPDGRAYPWGDEAPSAHFLNACGKECTAWGRKNHVDGIATFAAMYKDDDLFPTTAPVGSFPAGSSRYGLQDVVGNVWEWTGDFYAPYTKDAQKDPTGAASGDDGRVARGGAWNGSDPSWVRPTFRFHFPPEFRSYGIGFRCAAPLAPARPSL